MRNSDENWAIGLSLLVTMVTATLLVVGVFTLGFGAYHIANKDVSAKAISQVVVGIIVIILNAFLLLWNER